MPKHTKKQVIDWHRMKVAQMVESFIKQCVGKDEAEIINLYTRFDIDWGKRCWKIKRSHNEFIISFDVWERIWKVDGYLRIMTIPIPKQLPDDQKDKLKNYKNELLRIVYIIEGKTDKQRERRETWYKVLFLFVRIRIWFKSLAGNAPEIDEIEVENVSEKNLSVVK